MYLVPPLFLVSSFSQTAIDPPAVQPREISAVGMCVERNPLCDKVSLKQLYVRATFCSFSMGLGNCRFVMAFRIILTKSTSCVSHGESAEMFSRRDVRIRSYDPACVPQNPVRSSLPWSQLTQRVLTALP